MPLRVYGVHIASARIWLHNLCQFQWPSVKMPNQTQIINNLPGMIILKSIDIRLDFIEFIGA